MKKLLLFVLLVSLTHYSNAQGGIKVVEVDPNQIFSAVEVLAEFPGGHTKFDDYIKNNQQAPQLPAGTFIKIITQFVVEKDGTLSNIKFLREPSDVYNTEIIRLLKQSPKWTPGMQNGAPVRTYYTVLIKFGKE